MRCGQCQRENPPRPKLCNTCGAQGEVASPARSRANVPGRGSGTQCGLALASTAGSAPPPRFGSPQATTPPHLAEKILSFNATTMVREVDRSFWLEKVEAEMAGAR